MIRFGNADPRSGCKYRDFDSERQGPLIDSQGWHTWPAMSLQLLNQPGVLDGASELSRTCLEGLGAFSRTAYGPLLSANRLIIELAIAFGYHEAVKK